MKSFGLFVPILLAAQTLAHGGIRSVTIDGKYYDGAMPGSSQGKQSIVRLISSQDPINNVRDPAVNCGWNARKAALVANANPGSKFEINMGTGNGNWVHNTGPMLTYLGNCGQTTADKCESGNIKWFKIEQALHKPNSGEWYQGDLMSGQPHRFSLPGNLAPGNYLIRHEVIGLHLASEGQPELYSTCVQIRVGGNGNGYPRDQDLVSLPGGYDQGDAAFSGQGVYDNRAYPAPGPGIANLVGGGNGGNGGGNGGNGGGNAPSTPPPSSSAPSSPAPTKQPNKPSPPSGGSPFKSKPVGRCQDKVSKIVQSLRRRSGHYARNYHALHSF